MLKIKADYPSAKELSEVFSVDLREFIRTIPDFPEKGVQFRDITTLLRDRNAFRHTVDALHKRYKDAGVDVVVGIESRGFVFASVLAYVLGRPLVLVRKEGKLPHTTVKEIYALEYGTNVVEVHKDAIHEGENALIVDDLIATGGTLLAAIKMIEKLGGKVVECAVVVELPELKGRERLKNYPIFSLVKF